MSINRGATWDQLSLCYQQNLSCFWQCWGSFRLRMGMCSFCCWTRKRHHITLCS